MHGPTWTFWASLNTFSLQRRRLLSLDESAADLVFDELDRTGAERCGICSKLILETVT
jgi:hypothetical protein